ncbi:MAG: hypothetical protein ACRD4D_04705 [Candidatus Acidiferrales bacterium]
MSLRAKLAALAVIAAFLAQPLLGAALCWRMGATTGSCATPCPMEEQAPQPPAKAEANDSGCCEITAAEPASPTSLVANLSAFRTPAPAPITLPGLNAPPATVAPTPPEALPHATVSSLSLLYCVFLI